MTALQAVAFFGVLGVLSGIPYAVALEAWHTLRLWWKV